MAPLGGHPGAPRADWLPSSPCGSGCQPPREGWAVGLLLVLARLCGLAAVLSGTLAGVVLLPGDARRRWLCACYSALLRVSGVRVRVSGELGAGGALIVANHLSWVEVLAIGALRPSRVLAKREMGDWPVIGAVARRSGVLFVDRAGLRALPVTVAATAAALRRGSDVVVFPEGTTWCGAAAGPFRRAAFQAAIDAAAPVRPVAVVLRLPDGRPAPAAAFVGEQTLWDSLLAVLRLPALHCHVTVLPAVADVGDRRELARLSGAAVTAVTGVPHPSPAGRRRAPVAAVA